MLVCWIFLLISGNGFALKRATFLYLWNDEMPWTECYLLTHLASHQVLCAILGATLKKKGYKAIREHPEESYEEGDGCEAEGLWGEEQMISLGFWNEQQRRLRGRPHCSLQLLSGDQCQDPREWQEGVSGEYSQWNMPGSGAIWDSSKRYKMWHQMGGCSLLQQGLASLR